MYLPSILDRPFLLCILLVASLVTGCADTARPPAREPAPDQGLRHASATFDADSVTVRIPLDAMTWGRPVELDESAGLASARFWSSLSGGPRTLPAGADLPDRTRGAFGMVVPGMQSREWSLDYVIWPQADLDGGEYLLLDCYADPVDPTDPGVPPRADPPRGDAARRLRDQVRRARLGNVAVLVTSEQEDLVIRDNSLVEYFMNERPTTVDLYVNLKTGMHRATVPVVYHVPPEQGRPAPTFN